MQHVVLALDISSVSTGWSVFKNGKLHKHGKIVTSKIKKHSERLVFFDIELRKLFEKFKPNIFAVEDVFVGRSPKVHKILSLYHGVAYKCAFEYLNDDPITIYESEARGIISDSFNVALRKSGEKAKKLTFDFINQHYNLKYTFENDNDITDAIAVGLAISVLGDLDEKSLGSFRSCARSKPKRNKKGVSEVGAQVSPRQKSKRPKSRRKVQGSK